jgi:hypothetical protein
MTQKEFTNILGNLTKQEEKVLSLFLEGKDDLAIADILFCTEGTVRSHLSNICRRFKLTEDEDSRGCSHRDELIHLFIKYKGEWVAPCVRRRVGYHEFEYPSGQVPLNSYFYMSRNDSQNNNIESYCYREILKPGALIRIKAPKLIGKTSLMLRILAEAKKQEKIRAVNINLAEAEREILESLERFLRWFCVIVGRRLNIDDRLDNYWDNSSGGSIFNCTEYFEHYLLPEIDCPLVLVLDEVERVFPYAQVAPEFFSLLRLWHENTNTQTNPIFQNLRLIIAHSTEVYVRLKSTESPFNVGIPIELSDFIPEQIKTLAIRHELGWGDSQVEELMAMVEGHPYLVRLALYHLATKQMSLEQLLQQATTEAGIYSDHLRVLLEELRCNPILAEAYKQVVMATSWIELETMQIYLLWSLGLVKKHNNQVMPRCELYRQYFLRVL